MARVSQALIEKTFPGWVHPYRQYENTVESLLRPGSTVLDIGCGRTAPLLQKYRGRGLNLIGVDCVEFTQKMDEVELLQRDLVDTGLPADHVDVAIARSVMEHVTEPEKAFSEFARILKPGGSFVFLTASSYDYASLIARLVPNKLHGRVVKFSEGRAEEDVFPTAYKCNTRSQITRLAHDSGLTIESLRYLGQYPNYFLFNQTLFRIASAYEKVINRYDALQPLRGWILAVLRKASST